MRQEEAADLRMQLEQHLRQAAAEEAPDSDEAALAHGREVWTSCEALTSGGALTLAPQTCLLFCQNADEVLWPSALARRANPIHVIVSPSATMITMPTSWQHRILAACKRRAMRSCQPAMVTWWGAAAMPGLAGELTESLRQLLEPTRARRLAGDFRTGKRLSMRKVVAYIASHFRRDKIWLRRTRPDQRQYQVNTLNCPKQKSCLLVKF